MGGACCGPTGSVNCPGLSKDSEVFRFQGPSIGALVGLGFGVQGFAFSEGLVIVGGGGGSSTRIKCCCFQG